MSEATPRRSRREHQPSIKAASSSFTVFTPDTSLCTQQRCEVLSSTSLPSTFPMTPPLVQSTVTSLASFDTVSVVENNPAKVNIQHRKLRAAAHTMSSGSLLSGTSPFNGVQQSIYSQTNGVSCNDNKLLGKYSSHDCLMLCEVILSQLEKQTLASTVLDEEKSPAFIRWELVAEKMKMMQQLKMTPRECQLLWRFLAYGQIPVLDIEKEERETLRSDSDEAIVYQNSKKINCRLAAERTNTAVQNQGQIAVSIRTTDAITKEETAPNSIEVLRQNQVNESKENAQENTVNTKESSIKLYPTYSLPTGAPDAWCCSFGPKDALPLTFVASRFLRRKPSPSPAQARFEKSTVKPVLKAAGTANLKRYQEPPANSAESKQLKLFTPVVSKPPCSYKPSLTPLVAAARAPSALDFFELRLREEQAQKMPVATFELSATDVQNRYKDASAEVRHQCQTLAAHEVERFDRKIVRANIEQRAMEAVNTKAKPTAASIASSALKPAASMSQSSSTAASAGNAAASSATSSGPATALFAHVAANTTAIARNESIIALTKNTSNASNSADVNKRR
ncbi:unnamed protein product [Peronospora belbahrii]|uniref:Uncharacterized protein n=1 Tax=Peronospora belbahrii TaxID=622444 RepID=A0AAU9KUP1_9STRA|nr:unnamed protein product [Peronospora belbahrii]